MNEQTRLIALSGQYILDKARDDRFDRIAEFAADLFDADVALITFFDSDRQWFKAHFGTDAQDGDRALAMCNETIKTPEVLVCEDTTKDSRFADHPYVSGAPHIRFYAGTPLLTPDGDAIGTLCVTAASPRTVDDKAPKRLHYLGRLVEDLLENFRVEAAETPHAPSNDGSASITDEMQRELHALFRTSPKIIDFFDAAGMDGLWYCDLEDQRRQWLSPGFKALLGYADALDPDCPVGWSDVVDADDLAAAESTFLRLNKDPNHPFDQILRFRHRDGSTVWVRCRGSIIRDRNGKPVRILGAYTDVTALKEAERRAVEAARLQSAILNATEDGIMLFAGVRDDTGAVVDLVFRETNPASLAITNRAREELIGARLSETFPGNFESGIFQHYKRALETQTIQSFEIHYTHEGLDHWFKVTAYPTDDACLVITFSDISDLKRANKQLYEQQQEWHFILDSVPARIWYKDDKNRILRLNKAAADSIGRSVEDVEGMHTADVFPDQADAYYRDDLDLLATGKSRIRVLEKFVEKDGKQRWLSKDKIPFADPNTGERRILVTATDITDLKDAETELRLAYDNLNQFASIASHDLQTPLRQIGMFADLLNEDYGSDLPEGAREYVERIEAGATRMRSMIKSLLEFSRATQDIGENRPVAMCEVLSEVRQTLAEDLAEANADIRVAEPLPSVLGDRTLLIQVMANLIANALKYRSESPPQIEISAHRANGLWEFAICDNGLGVDPMFKERIFELFGRVHAGNISGTGIGLALCRRIVTLHGGEIWLDPDQKDGSCFRFTLRPVPDLS